MLTPKSSTIAAIATAQGAGAVGIVRLSGPLALNILNKIFLPKNKGQYKPAQCRLGQALDINGQTIDEALAIYFKAPKSFTGEDVVEIQGHGGPVLISLILKAALNAGATLAQAGEFTQRAFLNGRLDLSQAEAVAELISAQSEAEVILAARQLNGELKNKIENISQAVFNLVANLEAELDFYEHLETSNPQTIAQKIKTTAITPLEKLLKFRKTGKIFKDGLKITIVGAPNAGKSSLFNALLEEDRALVSYVSGTTRDFLNEGTIWQGLRIELCDTAGLSNQSLDPLEKLGQEKSLEQLKKADLVLWVKDLNDKNDQSLPILQNLLNPKQTIIVWNKIDLASPQPQKIPPHFSQVFISAQKKIGLEEMKKAILNLLNINPNLQMPKLVPNLRQETHLLNTLENLQAAHKAATTGWPAEIITLELKTALKNLGQITGQINNEKILEEIFKNFCLGK